MREKLRAVRELCFRFPESMKIAVLINCDQLFTVSEEELCFWFIFRSKRTAVGSEICLDQDPLDIVFFHHRMFHEKMVMEVLDGMDKEETEVLTRALTKLQKFFRTYGNDK